VTYRTELSGRALKHRHGLRRPASDSLIEAMAEVIDDPLKTFPTDDPYVRRVEFGTAGLITYLINDTARLHGVHLGFTVSALASTDGAPDQQNR
jgi:hypothetical protein